MSIGLFMAVKHFILTMVVSSSFHWFPEAKKCKYKWINKNECTVILDERRTQAIQLKINLL